LALGAPFGRWVPACAEMTKMRVLGRFFVAKVVVGRVVAAEPALELGMRNRAAVGIAGLGARIVASELDGHAVGIDHIDRAAIAVLERIGRLEPGGLDSLFERGLCLLVDIE